MTFDQLQHLLADWYGVTPQELSLPEDKIPSWLNPVLKDFYIRFGALAEPKSRFAHPDSENWPLSCQDHIFAIGELKRKNGYTIFCEENQTVFVVAARDDPSDTHVYAKGDGVLSGRTAEEMVNMDVSLSECLLTLTLRETIMSVMDRYRKVTSDTLDAAFKEAQSGRSFSSRYIWPDISYTFHLSKDIWCIDMDGTRYAAHRGLWKREPSTWQEQVFEDGGGWLYGPSKPTLMQKIERFVSGLKI